jgi:hypothetical protein
MADLINSVLGGRWSLVIGWILPTFLSLQSIAFLVLPGHPRSPARTHGQAAEKSAAEATPAVTQKISPQARPLEKRSPEFIRVDRGLASIHRVIRCLLGRVDAKGAL